MAKTINTLYHTLGIYAIENKVNGMAYVGQTMANFGDRRDCHFAMLRKNYQSNKNLQKDWNEFGEENFEFKVLEIITDKSIIDDAERKWIEFYKQNDKSYNYSTGGVRGYRIKKIETEAIRKVWELNRILNTGKKASDETRKKMSLKARGRKASQETREKISKINKGRIHTEEQNLKNSIAHSGEKCWRAKHTIEQVIEIKKFYNEGLTNREISNITNISINVVYGITKGIRWKYV